ncbi:MAG: RHS repeat-associated core domain-containing protein [Bacteroidota bacterium]
MFKNSVISSEISSLTECVVSYRFGFNGKENDDETGTQDYGMRIYSPTIARFISADPLIVKEQKYAWYSPYQFAGNKAINSIDLDGLEECDSYVLQTSMGTDAYLKLQTQQTTEVNKAVVSLTSSVAKPIVIVGSSVLMPIAGQIYGAFDNSFYYPSWATAYTVDNWKFTPIAEGEDNSVPWNNGGKDILFSVPQVILTFTPFSVSENFVEKTVTNTVIRTPIKEGLKAAQKTNTSTTNTPSSNSNTTQSSNNSNTKQNKSASSNVKVKPVENTTGFDNSIKGKTSGPQKSAPTL